MSSMMFNNLFKVTRGIVFSSVRGYKYQAAGIMPGGGLGKLQGIKEEEYFSRQNHKLFENMRSKSKPVRRHEFKCIDYEHDSPILCSVKHKNVLEESYFLNDHCDCLQILKSKNKNQDS